MTSKRVFQLSHEEEEDDDILLCYLYGKRRCEIPTAKMEHGADESVKEQLHSEMTIKTEVEEAAQSSAHVDTKIPAAKMEHRADESVREKLHSEMTIKTEVENAVQSSAHVDNKIPATKMEHGADEIVNGHSEMTIKTEIEEVAQSSAHVDTKVRLPSHTSTRGIVARTSVSADDVAQGQLLHIKEELEDADLDIGPTVLQHMDSRYRSHQEHTYNTPPPPATTTPPPPSSTPASPPPLIPLPRTLYYHASRASSAKDVCGPPKGKRNTGLNGEALDTYRAIKEINTKTPDVEDDIASYGSYVAAQLRKLEPHLQSKAKLGIQSLLHKFELENLEYISG